MRLVASALAASILLLAPAAYAADASDPCSAFAWPLTTEKALLANAEHLTVPVAGRLDQGIPIGFRMTLSPDASATFVKPPQKTPSPDGFGGTLTVSAPATAGDYLVTLSSEGWIDVIQNDAAVASTAHSGAKDCPGMRKSVKFPLAANAPLILQISSAPASTIDIAITKVP